LEKSPKVSERNEMLHNNRIYPNFPANTLFFIIGLYLADERSLAFHNEIGGFFI